MAATRDSTLLKENPFIFTGITRETAYNKLKAAISKKWLVRQSIKNKDLLCLDYCKTDGEQKTYTTKWLALIDKAFVDVTEPSIWEQKEKTITPVYKINILQLTSYLDILFTNGMFATINATMRDGLSAGTFVPHENTVYSPSSETNPTLFSASPARQKHADEESDTSSEDEKTASSSTAIIDRPKQKNLANRSSIFTFDQPSRKPTLEERNPPKPNS